MHGALRPGISVDDAATIFAVGHQDVYRFFIDEQGWQPEDWARWWRRGA